MDVNDTIRYITGLTAGELRHMPEAVSRAGLRKFIRIILKEYDVEAPAWLYVGRRLDHIIVPKMYCTCKSFVIKVMTKKQRLSCKHLVAQWIAETNNTYRELYITIREYMDIVNEISRYGFSPTLRKLLYARQKEKHGKR